jgi:hypothetical protein
MNSQPIRYAHGNLVFPELGDPWALYRLALEPYAGLPVKRKLELKQYLEAFAYRIGSDFQILRASRPWSVDAYVERAAATASARTGHGAAWSAYLERHRAALAERKAVRPEVFACVRLRAPRPELGDVLAAQGPRALVRTVADVLGLRDARAIRRARLERFRQAERQAFERIFGYLDCERATTDDLQWLVRRAYTRGLGEPRLDRNFRPEAITFLAGDGEELFEPYELDLLRLHESRVTIGARHLYVESELGESWQALLSVGTLPETSFFPGPEAELLFHPFDQLGFPVDTAFSAEFVPNRQALALARRRKIDADNIFDEERHGNHGPSADAAERPQAARELEALLSASERPPLLRAAITLAVGAPSERELEERVEAIRAEFGRIELHRPVAEQHRLFLAMLPAQRFPLPEYRAHLQLEQFGAMVPIASSHAGSETGPYIGHTLSGSRQPVQFDLAEACQRSRPPTVLAAGTLGSGKTMLTQLLCLQAFLQGSRIVAIDPKGDWGLTQLAALRGHVEEIELTAEARWRGLLDPLRIAAPEVAFDLTVNFLVELLPRERDDAVIAIQEEVKRALAEAERGGSRPTCGEVVERLRASADEGAVWAARALAIHCDAGLAQLGFAAPGTPPPEVGAAQVVSLRIRNLPRPVPGTQRADYTKEERIGQAVLRLVAIYAMHLMGGDRSLHKVLALDEAWFLLEDSVGHRLIEQLSRWGRAENATPILVTHLVSDAEDIDNLIGARFVFGMESEAEAGRALRLLRLDDDDRLRQRLLSFREGRCLFRDLDGHVVQMRVDLVDGELLRQLDTTPGARTSAPEADGDAAAAA